MGCSRWCGDRHNRAKRFHSILIASFGQSPPLAEAFLHMGMRRVNALPQFTDDLFLRLVGDAYVDDSESKAVDEIIADRTQTSRFNFT